MPKLPFVDFWGRDLHNVQLIWKPGFRRRNYRHFISEVTDEMGDGPIVPVQVTLGFRGIGREIARQIAVKKGLPLGKIRRRPTYWLG